MRYMAFLLAILLASPAWSQFYVGGSYGGLGSEDPIGDETAAEIMAGISFGDFNHLEIQALESSFDTGKNQIVSLAYYRDFGDLTFLPFIPYAGAGVGRISLSLNSDEHLGLLPTGAIDASCPDSSLWAGMAAVGGRVPLYPNLEFGVEIRYYLAENLKMECAYTRGGIDDSEEIELETAPQLVSFRIVYRF